MKASLIILLVSITVVQVQAAKLVSATAWTNPETKKIEVFQNGGLKEDGFTGPDSVCFVGKIKDVCEEVKVQEQLSHRAYIGGGHGKFIVDSCRVITYQDEWTDTEQSLVEVNYTRENDYHDEDDGTIRKVSLAIRSCN